MKKTSVKLLAVVTLASTPALADPAPATPDPWAAATNTTTFPDTMPPQFRRLQAESLVASMLDVLGVRRLPSGAPACGNVQSKSPMRRYCPEPQAPEPITADTNPPARERS